MTIGTSPAARLQSRYLELATSANWYNLDGQPVGLSPALEGTPTSESYWQDQLSLAIDPARGTKIGQAGLEEAAVAVHAQNAGVLRCPQREKTGASEFVDGRYYWDVKSPVSPLPGANWQFDVNHQVEVVKDEIRGKERVLLNLTRCTPEDAEAVRSALVSNLSSWESKHVKVLMKKAA